MRIGVDIRCLTDDRYSGINEVTHHLLTHLLAIDSSNQYIFFYNSAKAARIPEFWQPNVTMRGFRYPNRFFNLSLRFLKIVEIDKLIGGVDAFFIPNFLFLHLSKNCRRIQLVHDLSFELYPQFFTWKKRLWHYLIGPKQFCEQADQILAISENTKGDIIRLYGVDRQKIVVAHPGINDIFFSEITERQKQRVKEKYRLPEEFCFSLSNLEPRKNLESLVIAFQRVDRRLSLVIAGAEAWKFRNVYRKAHQLLTEERIKFLGYVDQADKPALYALSKAFVYPSMYEGFGLPPLEAMASGAPVICSQASSLPEAVGEAALLIDPYNTESIVQAINQLVADPALGERLRQRGRLHAANYRWNKRIAPFAQAIAGIAPPGGAV